MCWTATPGCKIHAAGWNFCFIATEVKVMFLGGIGAAKIGNALQRLLRIVRPKTSSLEITGIVARHFWACLTLPFPRIHATCKRVANSIPLRRDRVHSITRNGPLIEGRLATLRVTAATAVGSANASAVSAEVLPNPAGLVSNPSLFRTRQATVSMRVRAR